ncbi:MAG: hypothetical protein Q9207_008094 [Kuettlingeria erythrocarpa]
MVTLNLGAKYQLQILTVLSVIGAATANCYYPNGTDRNQGLPTDVYLPINPGDEFNTNNSPGVGRQMDNDEQVTPCTDGSYCCGDGSLGSTCCSEGRGVFVRDGTTQNANPTVTSASSTASTSASESRTTPFMSTGVSAGRTATGTTSLASTSTPTAAASSQASKVNVGAIAGGVVGGLAGLFSIVLAAWYLFLRKRKANQAVRHEMAQPQEFPSVYDAHGRSEPQEAQGSYHEEYKRSELQAGPTDGAMGRSELDSKHIPTPLSR